jgi:hypothetical protein
MKTFLTVFGFIAVLHGSAQAQYLDRYTQYNDQAQAYSRPQTYINTKPSYRAGEAYAPPQPPPAGTYQCAYGAHC